MNKEEFEKYRKDRYEKAIAWYDKRAIWNRRAFQIFQWATVILASLTPVLIVVGEGWTRWLAVGVAVSVAITTGALKAFKYEGNWINYRTTCETLRKEVHFFEAGVQGYGAVEDKHSLFVERVESLISRENTLWLTTHKNEAGSKAN